MVLFYCCVVFHWMYIVQLIYAFICLWILGYLQFGVVSNKAVVRFHLQVLVWTYIFISLG